MCIRDRPSCQQRGDRGGVARPPDAALGHERGDERGRGDVEGGVAHSGGGERRRGAAVRNPAFDVTPAALVTALVTERGVARPPDAASIAALLA